MIPAVQRIAAILVLLLSVTVFAGGGPQPIAGTSGLRARLARVDRRLAWTGRAMLATTVPFVAASGNLVWQALMAVNGQPTQSIGRTVAAAGVAMVSVTALNKLADWQARDGAERQRLSAARAGRSDP